MKKTLFAVVFTAVVIMCMSITAFALTDGDWEFQLLDNEVTITGYLGSDEDVVVPSTLFGTPVTKVEINSHNKDFRNVKYLEYPGTVKEIGRTGLDDTLEKITLNEGTEILTFAAFNECRNIKSVRLPSTMKEIGAWAFRYCSSLSSINLPEGIQKIDSCAFENTAITEVDLSTLPDECKLSHSIFAYCKNLKSVKFRTTETEVPEAMFNNCTALQDVEMPNTVTVIGSYAFEDCISLSQIILPTSLEKISWRAFNRTGLKEVVIPYGVRIVWADAFGGSKSLKALYIPDTVTEMGYSGSTPIDESNNCIIYCTAGSYAAQYCKKTSISYLTDNSVNSSVTVYYNGTRVSFHTYDQNPELINDRTLVPLRAIFEAMGADVQWDNETHTVTSTRDGVTIKITIGDNTLYRNGQSVPVDVPAQLVNDRTMIPVRVIAESFGADVQWNNNGRAVLITE